MNTKLFYMNFDKKHFYLPGELSFGSNSSMLVTSSSCGAWMTSTVEPMIDNKQPILP